MNEDKIIKQLNEIKLAMSSAQMRLSELKESLNKEPREWWIVKYPLSSSVYPTYGSAFNSAGGSFEEIIHVKEVIE